MTAALRHLPGVSDTARVTGPCDVIARRSRDIDELGKLVATQVRTLDGVTRTLICTVIHIKGPIAVDHRANPTRRGEGPTRRPRQGPCRICTQCSEAFGSQADAQVLLIWMVAAADGLRSRARPQLHRHTTDGGSHAAVCPLPRPDPSRRLVSGTPAPSAPSSRGRLGCGPYPEALGARGGAFESPQPDRDARPGPQFLI